MTNRLRRSVLDSRRFGVEVHRAQVDSETDLEAIDTLARSGRLDLVIARTSTHRLDLAQALEARGFFLCDTLVHYRGAADRIPNPPDDVEVRFGMPSDADALGSVAFDAFESFLGHYHADPRLEGDLATQGYVEWAQSSLHDEAGWVLLALDETRVVGFITLRAGPQVAEILLNGVLRSHQGRGVYAALFRAAAAEAVRRGLGSIVVSTQVHNLAPQKVWTRHGLEPAKSEYTFHGWFRGEHT